MNDDSLQYTPVDLTDTLRPPPPEMPRPCRPKARAKSYPVTVRCEDEKQRAMLVDWLGEAGFEVEPRS